MKIKMGISLCFAALSSAATASPLDYFFQEKLSPAKLSAKEALAIQEKYFDQFIDHTHPNDGTFKQRYYIDESYAQSNNSPVFLYICGEASCDKKNLAGNIRNLAQKYHARLVAIEHRYYGKSWPTTTASAADLKYLTTDNALKDLARFQTSISNENHWQGKWVALGGSYPGNLSAYYRATYPDKVVGALASSAPVKAQEFFPEYDRHVAQVAGPACAERLRIATHEIEAALANPKRIAEIKKMFGAEKIQNNLDFLNLLADISGGAVQSGLQATMCSMLASAATPLEGYAKGVKLGLQLLGMNAVSASIQGAMDENIDTYSAGFGARQWLYQSCTEYGYWQIANLDSTQSTRSALLNQEYERGICKRLFGIETKANTDYINSKYYLPLLGAPISNIYFTNGANDPWSTLSISIENGNATNPTLDYFTIANASHCTDLKAPNRSDAASLKAAREQLDKLIAKWLV